MVQVEDEDPVHIAEIAEEKDIPLNFLENILLELKKEGILDSKKGKHGGYFFKENPATISLARIMRLLDGPIALMPCVSLHFYESCKNCVEEECGLRDTLAMVRDQTLEILEKKMIADLAEGLFAASFTRSAVNKRRPG